MGIFAGSEFEQWNSDESEVSRIETLSLSVDVSKFFPGPTNGVFDNKTQLKRVFGLMFVFRFNIERYGRRENELFGYDVHRKCKFLFHLI